MCTIKEVKDKGYFIKPSVDASPFNEEKKCLAVKMFLDNFDKYNCMPSITGRTDDQLFPLKDIIETYTEPSLTFTNENYNIYYDETSIENTFTMENLSGLTASVVSDQASGMTGGATVTISESDGTISVTMPANIGFRVTQFTVTVTGERIDGKGEYSKSFIIKQAFRLLKVILNGPNNMSLKDVCNNVINLPTPTAGKIIYLMPLGCSDLKDYPMAINRDSNASESWVMQKQDNSNFTYSIKKDNNILSSNTTTSLKITFDEYIQYGDYNNGINIWFS